MQAGDQATENDDGDGDGQCGDGGADANQFDRLVVGKNRTVEESVQKSGEEVFARDFERISLLATDPATSASQLAVAAQMALQSAAPAQP